GYDSTDESVLERAHAHDARLVSDGAVVGVAGRPVQVRNTGGTGIVTKDRAFLISALPVAGFALIEADDLQSAIELVAGTPCAVAHGVVEVWPLIAPQASA
ncbi:MAG: transcription initiation protein, partial [Acidimicrobiales bacterium]